MVSTYVDAFIITHPKKVKEKKKKKKKSNDNPHVIYIEPEEKVRFERGLKASNLNVDVLAKILSYCEFGTFKNIY